MSSKNSPSEPFYISLEVALEIHQRQLKEFGELYEAMLAIAERRMSKDDLARLFERLVSEG